MGQAYPELSRGEAMIKETIKLEEERFLKTLSRGLQILEDETEELNEGATLDGATAFKLYDTYGFPLDLTQDALRQRGIGVDQKGFDEAMAAQKAEARKNWSGSGDAASEAIWFKIADQNGTTEFLGYETEQADGEVVAIVKDGAEVTELAAGDEGILVFNQTPFYGESGGQVGDTGHAHEEDVEVAISNTTKMAGVFAHHAKIEQGTVKVGDALHLSVNGGRRQAIRANHSATHLLHEALRETLGDHVAQKGSMVAPDRLRFDFSHTKAVGAEDMEKIEQMANAVVLQNSPVETRLMEVDDAIEAGAMALFGEKYGDEVRVVSMGKPLNDNKGNQAYSMELCGGTHVKATGEIGVVAVVGESAVASGVRRIEALTGDAARAYFAEQEARVRQIADRLKVSPKDVVDRVDALIEERKQLEKQLADARQKLAMGGGAGGGSEIEKVGDVSFMGRVADGLPSKELRGLVDQGKEQIKSGIVAIVGIGDDGKVGVAVGVTDDLKDKLSAVDLVKVAVETLGGKGGGGRPDMAQGGGPNADKAQDAIDAVRAKLAE
jgi:alanyl-tRNA synthetase